MLHRHASAEALGAGRICIYGLWLVLVAATPVQWHADVPFELFNPWGPLRLAPNALYQAALTPGFLSGFKATLLVLLALLVLGVRPFTPLAVLAFAMLWFHDGMLKAWQGTHEPCAGRGAVRCVDPAAVPRSGWPLRHGP